MRPGHYKNVPPADVPAHKAKGWTVVSTTAQNVLMSKPFGWVERNRFRWERAGHSAGLQCPEIRIIDGKLGTGDYATARHIAVCWDADVANAIVEALNERELL